MGKPTLWLPWRLECQGPLTGPGLITSFRYVEIPDTEPGGIAEIDAPLEAPGYDRTSIAYFKMVGARASCASPTTISSGSTCL